MNICSLLISCLTLFNQIDGILTIIEAGEYPYIVNGFNDLYMPDSHPITVIYSVVAVAAILLSLSTGVVCYRSSTNYTVVHACITGVFLPILILVYFTTRSFRYKVDKYDDDIHQMVTDYRLPLVNDPIHPGERKQQSQEIHKDLASTTTPESQPQTQTDLGANNHAFVLHKPHKLNSFINLIDVIQSKFSCCGVNSTQDWTEVFSNYIPPSCCVKKNHISTVARENWTDIFKVESDHQFLFCEETHTYGTGCLMALKADERNKYEWLGNLMIFLILSTIANTIFSMLLFGLHKTEEIDTSNLHELAVVKVSTIPRPSQPTITGISPRKSIVHTTWKESDSSRKPSKETIANLSQAVRFNISNSPRASIAGPSKFSPAARRGSCI